MKKAWLVVFLPFFWFSFVFADINKWSHIEGQYVAYQNKTFLGWNFPLGQKKVGVNIAKVNKQVEITLTWEDDKMRVFRFPEKQQIVQKEDLFAFQSSANTYSYKIDRHGLSEFHITFDDPDDVFMHQRIIHLKNFSKVE